MSRAIEDVTREERRPTLSRDRVLDAAIELADGQGIGSVSMRNLGQLLGVEAMSLYTHVRGKEDLLDGMADRVVAQIEPSPDGADWRATMRATIMAARAVFLEHAWAARVMESREQPGPASVAYMNRIATILVDGGFPVPLAHHGLHALGSRVFGFNQDLFDDKADDEAPAAADILEQLAAIYPNLAAIAATASHEGGLGGCDDDIEFAFGLDLVLDGLEARRAAVERTADAAGDASRSAS
jgi:AcrR family transcriptional regulator